jgi:hypothetical protein
MKPLHGKDFPNEFAAMIGIAVTLPGGDMRHGASAFRAGTVQVRTQHTPPSASPPDASNNLI